MTVRRVVFDTNVLLSALIFQNPQSAWLRETWQSGSVAPLISKDTASELLRVLRYPKFALTDDDREDLLAEYLPWCEVVSIPHPPPIVPECRDQFDKPFLELALVGAANALVTGDKDLLALKPDFPIPILTIGEFKQELMP